MQPAQIPEYTKNTEIKHSYTTNKSKTEKLQQVWALINHINKNNNSNNNNNNDNNNKSRIAHK
jgi:hypothetical protein